MSKISIIIPIYNEEKYIKSCIESIIKSDYKKEDMEVLLVDGMSSDGTREIIKIFQKKYSFIRVLDNKKKIAPIAMNIGIKHARGDFIFIISAHASYAKNYFTKLTKHSIKLDADCVGPILITDVKNKNSKSNSIKEILSHKLGVGNASFRTGSAEIIEVDTVAFGCYRKEVFEKYGLYNEELVRNQDIELNKRIIHGGGKIYLVPDVKSTYYARENFSDLAKNNYGNGKWNILTAYLTKTLNSLSLRHFIPLLFIFSLLVPILLYPFFSQSLYMIIMSLFSYSTLVIITSLKLKNSANSFIHLVLSFFVLHFSYGVGSLVGVFSVVKKLLKGEK